MTCKSLGQTFLVILALFFSIGGIRTASAQTSLRANIDFIDDQQFPLVEVYVSFSDTQSQPIQGLPADSFTVSEDSVPIQPLEISEIENLQQPLAIAMVMDVSGSMRSAQSPSPLEQAISAAKVFSDQLTSQDQVAVVKFADTPTIVQQLTTDKNAVKLSLDGLQPEGNYTTIYDALIEATNILKSYSGRKIIVLVTDGQDSGTGVFDFDHAVREASSSSIPIYPLGFGTAVDQDELTRLAKLTGGTTQFHPSASDLEASFDNVLQLLREQYLIRYLSSFPADEKQHNLLVTTTYQGTQLQASRFFTARSSAIPVILQNYQEGEIVGGLEKFQPTTDWPAPIEKLEIEVDGVLLASIESEPFEYEWNSTETEKEIPIGSHEFEFTFTDIAGNTGQTRLELDVQPPITVQIIQPITGETLSGSTPITAEVVTLSDIELSSVEIAIDGQVIGGSITAPPFETQWDLEDVTAGKHTITVTGYDTTGQFAGQDEITIDVAVGSYSWMIALIVLLVIVAVMIPTAVKRRKQMTRSTELPQKAGLASLKEVKGLNVNQVWSLGDNEVRLGRKRDENDIPLAGRNASRKHAIIRCENGHYVIYGLNSENPVVLNNMPMMQPHTLQQGDEIQLGDTVLKFEQNNT